MVLIPVYIFQNKSCISSGIFIFFDYLMKIYIICIRLTSKITKSTFRDGTDWETPWSGIDVVSLLYSFWYPKKEKKLALVWWYEQQCDYESEEIAFKILHNAFLVLHFLFSGHYSPLLHFFKCPCSGGHTWCPRIQCTMKCFETVPLLFIV